MRTVIRESNENEINSHMVMTVEYHFVPYNKCKVTLHLRPNVQLPLDPKATGT